MPDALACDLEPLADFLERVLALFTDAEPQPEALLLLRREHRQRALALRGEVLVSPGLAGCCAGCRSGLFGRARRLVLEKISELRILADRRLERERLARRLEDEPNLLGRGPPAPGGVFPGGVAGGLGW